MALQNRVDPWGMLKAVNSRGAWLGNRGMLHNEDKEIIAPWKHKSWVTCQLQFNNRKREIFSPGKYSELFFLDEATALSAGHHPCAECRRQRYNEFKNLWLKCITGLESISAAEIDKKLHAERAARGGIKVKHFCVFEELPDGAFIEIGGEACLLWNGELKKWSFEGYVGNVSLPAPKEVVTLLTPPSIVELLKNGFVPQVHESAIS